MNAHDRLIADLESVVGAGSVFHSPSDLLVYEYDGSVEGAVDLARPIAVVLPRAAEQVAEVVKIGKRSGLPIIPRGAGTGLSGGAVAQSGGIIVALTRMDQILSVDYENEIALVEPGVINLELSDFTGQRGYFFAPDPSSQRACTIGGNVAENSGGPHCLKYGVTTNHVLGLEFVTAEGEVKWVQNGQAGYDLTAALVGSEGMLGIVTKARVKITPAPEQVSVILAAFPDIEAASQAVTAVISAGIVPAALEMMDALTIQAVEPAYHAGYPMDAGAVLLIEIDGRPEDVQETQAEIESICHQAQAMQVRSATSKVERDLLWKGRKMAIAAMGRLAPNYYLHDTVVPRTRLPETMKRVYEIADDFSLPIANMFHAGDGNLHPLMLFDRHNKSEVERVLEASKHLITYCVDIGGALTGEHGIGTEKRGYMRLVYDENDLAAMAGVKQTFDPAAMFNPEKIFPSGYVCGEVRALRAQAIAQKHGIYPM